jgi:GTPase SAR1 family protein
MFREFKFDTTRFDDGNKKRMIKIVFLGPSNAGKTTIINQFINNHFNREHIKTNDAV